MCDVAAPASRATPVTFFGWGSLRTEKEKLGSVQPDADRALRHADRRLVRKFHITIEVNRLVVARGCRKRRQFVQFMRQLAEARRSFPILIQRLIIRIGDDQLVGGINNNGVAGTDTCRKIGQSDHPRPTP